MVKLMMTWNIRPGKEETHIEFIAKTFIPRLVKLDVRLADIWSTLHGDAPQIAMLWVAEDKASLSKTLSTREWRSLHEQLNEYVTDFRYKIVPLDTIV
jgi:hypothetical protein